MNVEQLMIQSAIANWRLTIRRLSNIFSVLSENEFSQEIAPGKNRFIYILGHLTAIHDGTLEVLGIGARQYPELDEIFIMKPDRSVDVLPPGTTLLASWTDTNDRFLEGLQALTPEQWVQRHASVSEEEYAINPARNRMSVVLNRTNHASYHLGQLLIAPR